ncbi:hypothetical protein MtrunA17_Chr3g0122791 [Medicago truncatula]|uniref:Uncharacterized protein n=1 Tax=Medicago truncatula TaxID=3880 RepID=A0A396IXW2_MEDTR|nr:hypothetical protein MtrunA17_Chr3g0122791 [Medicago truncatula]
MTDKKLTHHNKSFFFKLDFIILTYHDTYALRFKKMTLISSRRRYKLGQTLRITIYYPYHH